MRQVPVEQQLDFDELRLHVVDRQTMRDVRRDPHAGWHLLVVQRNQHIDRRGIAFRDRRRRIAGDDRFGSEILDQQQAVGDLGLEDLRRGVAKLAQPVRHRDERHDVLGQMRDLAVGLAVPHRRPVGPSRSVHQDGAVGAEREPLIAARRGVALDAAAVGLREARGVEKAADHRDALGARRELAVAGHAHVAMLRSVQRRQREGDIEAVRRQESRRPVRPFQQHDGVLRQVVETELRQLARAFQPVKVRVHQRKARQVIGLHQREGRARHRNVRIVGQKPDHGAGERGLAGAEIAGQRHQIAGIERGRDIHHQAPDALFARQRDAVARSAGGDRKHRHTFAMPSAR